MVNNGYTNKSNVTHNIVTCKQRKLNQKLHLRVWEYESMRVCEYESMRVWEYESMWAWEFESMWVGVSITDPASYSPGIIYFPVYVKLFNDGTFHTLYTSGHVSVLNIMYVK